MKVSVQDANVLIDLWDVGLLAEMFELQIEFHTTDLILAEITIDSNQKALQSFIKSNKLIVHSLSAKALLELIEFKQDQGKLSLEDCSVWMLAKDRGTILLTGDSLLRKKATTDGIEVHGSIWVLDKMIAHKIITKEAACIGIQKLSQINLRLPAKAIKQRIKIWCKN
ncbi:MAG: PIN domain-containing protein [Bacteroidetes bacterium]|nr:PIN domain-containing protein [Bacteroidota bacterium]